MKTVYNRFLLVTGSVVPLLALLLAGCDSVMDLDEKPSDFYAPSNVFNSVAAARSVVDGIYVVTGNQNNNAADWRMGEAGFDVRQAGFKDAYNQGDWLPDDDDFRNSWAMHYSAIGRANFALEGLRASDIPESVKNQLMGEVLFLRGYHYFFLVRAFGGVPLITTSETTDENLYPTRASAEEVYQQVFADLKEAAEKLPPFSSQKPGYASKGAAQGILARAYLLHAENSNTADFQQVCTITKDIISSGQHTLLPKPSDVFVAANEKHSEWMFAYPASGVGGNTQQIMYLTFPNNLNNQPNTFTADPNDLFGRASMSHLVDTLMFDDIFDKARDLRWQAWTWEKYIHPTTNKVTMFKQASPALTKYFEFTPGNVDYQISYLDMPILRYADVLLMAAEACNEVGDQGYAAEQLNKVRVRAGLSPVSGLSKEAFRDVVLEERRRELFGEGLARYDLIRRGRYLDHAELLLAQGLIVTGNLTITNEHGPRTLLYPIPQEELDRNPKLTQNPGY